MVETPADVSPHATAHEETDVNVRALNTFMICLVVSLLVTGVLVYWQYRLFENKALANDPPPSPRAEERVTTPGPGLLIDELTTGRDFISHEKAELDETAYSALTLAFVARRLLAPALGEPVMFRAGADLEGAR